MAPSKYKQAYMKCIHFPEIAEITDRFHETYKGGSMSTFPGEMEVKDSLM